MRRKTRQIHVGDVAIGGDATIVVQSGGASSNTVTVQVAATAPGIYSLDQSGSGPGAILHADFTLVSAAKPATSGETVLIYLTGLGATNPPVTDGTLAPAANTVAGSNGAYWPAR